MGGGLRSFVAISPHIYKQQDIKAGAEQYQTKNTDLFVSKFLSIPSSWVPFMIEFKEAEILNERKFESDFFTKPFIS